MERGEMVFSRDSPVLDYWLSRCDGFTVRSGHRGIGEVERVATHDYRGRAEMLRVRSALGERLVPADRIAAVVPSRRLLILDRRPSRVGRAARSTWRHRGRVRRLGASIATHLLAFASLCGRVIARCVRVVEVAMRRVEGAVERAAKRGTPVALATGERGAVQAARLARATKRGGARLDGHVRHATPIVIDALERSLAAAGKRTASASRAGAHAARAYGDEMRERRRQRPPTRRR
jgi:hypothetical protein